MMQSTMLQQQTLQRYMLQQISQQQSLQAGTLERLVQEMAGRNEADLQQALKDTRAEVRWAAAWVIGDRELPMANNLISALADVDPYVQQAARRSLVRLSAAMKFRQGTDSRGKAARPVDFGPIPGAGTKAQARAVKKWQEWWAKREQMNRSPEDANSPRFSRSAVSGAGPSHLAGTGGLIRTPQ